MLVTTDEYAGMLEFETFRQRVGASYESTKQALEALGYKPRIPINDRRKRLYPESAVEEVRQWLRRQSP